MFALFSNTLAADVIHLRSGEKYDCNVLEIGIDQITVMILENEVKRTFSITEVKAIVFENGNVETFPIALEKEPDERVVELEKAMIEDKARRSGLTTGIAFCCALLFIIAMI